MSMEKSCPERSGRYVVETPSKVVVTATFASASARLRIGMTPGEKMVMYWFKEFDTYRWRFADEPSCAETRFPMPS